MAYCHNCGAQIDDLAVICPHCGLEQKQARQAANDSGSIGWGLLGCCLPLVGLILFLVWKDTQPRNARKAGWGALIGVLAIVVSYVVIFLGMGVLFAFLASY